MNRKNLTAAVLAGLAGVAGIVGSAQAVNINPDGLGQVLIFPYYTVNGNNTTVLSVVNTSDEAKAVKVRFLEGKNSREVLDFNLYMSPYDVWTASLYEDRGEVSIPENAGVPTMVTRDNSCTVPYIYGYHNLDLVDENGIQVNGGKVAFQPYALVDEDGYNSENGTGLGDVTTRGAEGHFEVIEMGVLTDESEGSATAITHLKGGDLPALGCDQLIAAWTDPDDLVDDDEGYWLDVDQGPSTDMADPIGGLFGGAAIVNVGNGAMYSYDATAIDGFSTQQMHFKPGTTEPNLNSGDVYDGVVFNDGVVVDYDFFDDGLSVDAVSYVFMHDSLMNEFTTNGNIGGQTEWVITFPTKHFYVYEGGIDKARAPFTNVWDPVEEKACEVVILDTLWDRNEQIPGTPDDPTGKPIPPVVSPAPPGDPDPTKPQEFIFDLCYETNVVAFGVDGGDILGSRNLHTINNATELFTADEGWARVELFRYDYDKTPGDGLDCDRDSGDVPEIGNECFERAPLGNLDGLPVAGFAVQEFENQFVGADSGKIANYGGIFTHKYTRQCASGYFCGGVE